MYVKDEMRYLDWCYNMATIRCWSLNPPSADSDYYFEKMMVVVTMMMMAMRERYAE